MADTFFSDITDKININVLSVCDSLNNYRDDINKDLKIFNDTINDKVCQLYNIIETKQNTITELKTQLEQHIFEETNFNKVSMLKTQDKEIRDLREQLTIQMKRNSLLETKLKNKKTTVKQPVVEEPVVEEPVVEEPVVEEPVVEEPVVEEPVVEEPVVEEPVVEEPVVEEPKKKKKDKKKKKNKITEPIKEEEKEPEPIKEEEKEPEPIKEEPEPIKEEEKEPEPVKEEPEPKKKKKKKKNKTIEEEETVCLENVKEIEYENKKYYICKKKEVYEISNDEGDIGMKIGTYHKKKVSFF
jgi:hypothetical protein